jgi:hypothetical protein
MTLTSKPLAIIVLVIMFGGIALSSAMGWWVTESTKQPITFTGGEQSQYYRGRLLRAKNTPALAGGARESALATTYVQ